MQLSQSPLAFSGMASAVTLHCPSPRRPEPPPPRHCEEHRDEAIQKCGAVGLNGSLDCRVGLTPSSQGRGAETVIPEGLQACPESISVGSRQTPSPCAAHRPVTLRRPSPRRLSPPPRHCEEHRDEAIQKSSALGLNGSLDCRVGLRPPRNDEGQRLSFRKAVRPVRNPSWSVPDRPRYPTPPRRLSHPPPRHCEEHRDEAIQNSGAVGLNVHWIAASGFALLARARGNHHRRHPEPPTVSSS